MLERDLQHIVFSQYLLHNGDVSNAKYGISCVTYGFKYVDLGGVSMASTNIELDGKIGKKGLIVCSEWYAEGFDPMNDNIGENDFSLASKAKVPKIETGRLHNGTHTLMYGLSSITTTPVKHSITFRRHGLVDAFKDRLMQRWVSILQQDDRRFNVVGMQVMAHEATIWVYSPNIETLFTLKFEDKRRRDNWLESPVYYFHDSDPHENEGEDENTGKK